MYAVIAIRFLALLVVGVASIVHFGWLPGFGVLAAVYLIMPEQQSLAS